MTVTSLILELNNGYSWLRIIKIKMSRQINLLVTKQESMVKPENRLKRQFLQATIRR